MVDLIRNKWNVAKVFKLNNVGKYYLLKEIKNNKNIMVKET